MPDHDVPQATEGDVPPSDDSVPSRWSRLVETPARRTLAVIAALAAAVGLATGTIELIRLVVPDDPPVVATIIPSKVIEPDVPWRTYRDAYPEVGGGDFTPRQLRTYGVVFTVELKVEGLKGKTGTLKWLELDRDGAELPVPGWVPRSLEIRPDKDEAKLTPTVWTPLPPVVDAFMVRFEFYDQEDTRRQFEESRLVELGGQ